MNPNPAKEQPSSSRSLSEERHCYLIALVEDSPADAFFIQEAITIHDIPANVMVIRDGEEAVRLVNRADAEETAPCPALFLVDLNIPTKNGAEVLAHIRNSKRCRSTPVVVVTSSDSEKDRSRVKALGANRYFHKPADYDSFLTIGEVIKDVLKIKA